jgi:hypothetical protein
MNMSRKTGVLGAVGAALLALTTGAWSAPSAQPLSADQAPPAWIEYAQRVSDRFQAALASDDEAAQRFHAYIDDQVAAQAPVPDSDAMPEAMPAELPAPRVKAWIDRTGKITRVEIDDLDSPQAQDDLRTLLLAQSVGAAPPRKMTQPVIVRLSVGAEL